MGKLKTELKFDAEIIEVDENLTFDEIKAQVDAFNEAQRLLLETETEEDIKEEGE